MHSALLVKTYLHHVALAAYVYFLLMALEGVILGVRYLYKTILVSHPQWLQYSSLHILHT